jgi:hypothetical protein
MTNPKIGPNRGNAGKGRPKGAKNKSTVKVKEAFEAAFEELGGVESLVTWGRTEKSEFYKLYAKLLPVQITGDEENPLRTITTIELVAPEHDSSQG